MNQHLWIISKFHCRPSISPSTDVLYHLHVSTTLNSTIPISFRCENDEGASDYHDNLHVEPVFEAFICPLTKKLMQDPVILENGQTFERTAIEKWLGECRENGRSYTCPSTLEELTRSTAVDDVDDLLTPNIALRSSIEEWIQRNEAAKLNLARVALAPGSSEHDVLVALGYIQNLCVVGNTCSQNLVRSSKVLIPEIVDRLRSSNRKVQLKALETLRMLVVGATGTGDAAADNNHREAIALCNDNNKTIRTIVKFLVHEYPEERLEAVSLLCELSESEYLSEKIGEVDGAILILVGLQSRSTTDMDVLTVQKATKTLENMERCKRNVTQMAENGRLEPLLRLLLLEGQGEGETQLEMASFLGELVMSNEVKVLVAKAAGSSLVNLMRNGDSKEKKAIAVKALNQISSHQESAKLLVEAGILPSLVKDLLTSAGNKELPMSLKETSANILANIVTNYEESASTILDQENHHTLVSEETVRDLLHLISNTGPAIETKLIEILVGLTSRRESAESVVVAIRSCGATINLIQFLEAPQKDLRLASVKLLENISVYMPEELIHSFCDSSGYLSRLISILSDTSKSYFSEEQVAAVGILAALPADSRLITSLQRENGFSTVIAQIHKVLRGEILRVRFFNPYLAGLVRVLYKLITIYSSHDDDAFVRENDLGALFTTLLQTNGNDEVLVISATALGILSRRAATTDSFLTRTGSSSASPFTIPWSKKKRSPKTSSNLSSLCSIHRGYCSSKEKYFCLVEGKAVDKLVSCLDHSNKEVVEAALTALCTLLDDNIADIKQGIRVLNYADGIRPIMNILLQQNHNRNSSTDVVLQQTAVWAVERMLRMDDNIAREVCQDPNIVGSLKQAYQHSSHAQTRYLAESALRHIDKMPNFSAIIPRLKF